MDALNPFKHAAFWTGMALGIPMLAHELAAEVWGTRPKPAPSPAPAPAPIPAAEELRIRIEASEEARDEIVAEQGAKLARSDDTYKRLHGERMLAGVEARRVIRKRKARS